MESFSQTIVKTNVLITAISHAKPDVKEPVTKILVEVLVRINVGMLVREDVSMDVLEVVEQVALEHVLEVAKIWHQTLHQLN